MPSTSTVYCIKCGCERPYSVASSREEISIKGVVFSAVLMSAHCRECGEEVYVPEINDENVKSREAEYRRAAKLITVEEVDGILKKYNIGACPLAKLLGFGDITITRYLDGQLPSRANSDILLRILASHKTMEEYLEKGKDKITAIAYQKCRGALDNLLQLYGEGKIELVTRYILFKAKDITPMALQKLLYYAQAFYSAIFGEDLFTDDCQAWAYGPVFPDIYYRYQDYGYNPIERPTDIFEEDFSELTTKEISLLNAVIDSFGNCSGGMLSSITHNERPWIEARGNLLPSDRSMTIIKRDTIKRYFRDVVIQYHILNPCDIEKYCDAMRKQVK